MACRDAVGASELGHGPIGERVSESGTQHALGPITHRTVREELGPRTLYHGHSYGGNALAAAVALRHLELLHERDVLTNVRARSVELRRLLDERVVPHRAVAAVRLKAISSRVSAKGASLVIEASEPVAYVATRPDPLTLLAYLVSLLLAFLVGFFFETMIGMIGFCFGGGVTWGAVLMRW